MAAEQKPDLPWCDRVLQEIMMRQYPVMIDTLVAESVMHALADELVSRTTKGDRFTPEAKRIYGLGVKFAERLKPENTNCGVPVSLNDYPLIVHALREDTYCSNGLTREEVREGFIFAFDAAVEEARPSKRISK